MEKTKVVDRKLTDAERIILRRYKGFTEKDTFQWAPASLRVMKGILSPKDIPVFTLHGLNGIEYNTYEDEYIKDVNVDGGNYEIKTGKRRVMTLKEHIRGWINFNDVEGNPIKFESSKDGLMVDKCMEKIPILLQNEIFNVITMNSTLTKEELEGLGC